MKLCIVYNLDTFTNINLELFISSTTSSWELHPFMLGGNSQMVIALEVLQIELEVLNSVDSD